MKFTKKNSLKLFIAIVVFMILFVMCLNIKDWLLCSINEILFIIIYYFLLKKLIPNETSAFTKKIKEQNIIIKIIIILFFATIIYETKISNTHFWSMLIVSLLWVVTFIELFKNSE